MGHVDLWKLFGVETRADARALAKKAGEVVIETKELQENANSEYKKFRDYVCGEELAGGGRRKNAAETETNEEERILAALSYILGPAGAMALYLLKESDRFVRFHAIQSMLFWLSGLLLVLVLILGIVTTSLAPVVAILCLGWVGYLMYHAERGEWEMIPLIGNFAKENC